ncbi:Hypothetical predicted protein [Olea europaea subsp. europaea]|uniref:Uncharacterized protein n=1 Tax=Olea europaea subsp. europaea TaxID=158383 RepID=A0A8S0U2D1_OLEEU|nr:Hypothetical predicted protein [Olea europaea subsp. europaea]
MKFEFRIPKSARLRAHISQRSNLKYMKIVMDQFDERHREDFCNSSLGYLADVPDTILCPTHLAASFQNHPHREAIWVYEALLEVGEHFVERLYLYATLRHIDAEAQQPYFSTLVPEDSEEEVSKGGRSEEQTSGGDEEKGASGSDPDGEDSEDIGESHGKGSSAGEDTRDGARGASSSPRPPRDPSPKRRSTTQARTVGTSAPSLTRGNVEELLLDQRILFEMRLRTVKLEIQQHVTLECTSLREFLATLVARAGPTTAEPVTRAETEAGVSGVLYQKYCSYFNCDVDVYGGPAEPCPYELDIAIDTGNMQDATHIAPSQDNLNLPVPAASEEVQRATEPSNDTEDDDEEADGCDAMDGDGVVTEVPASGPVPEV